jgi:hypothetical protein
MPVGKGKTRLQSGMRTELYDALLQEAKDQGVDLGAVIEGYIVKARQQGQAVDHVLAKRLETILHRQEQMLRVLETLVATLEGARPATSSVESEEGAVPIASYAQMYKTDNSTLDDLAPIPEAPVTPEQPPAKRSWRPW